VQEAVQCAAGWDLRRGSGSRGETMSYAIRWDLLNEDEFDILKRKGVEMHPNGMDFTRTLEWEEFCLVFAFVYGLQNRIGDDDNHINFAIGDCLNYGVDHFGQEAVDDFIKEHLALRVVRDDIISMTGATLILLQIVEEQIKVCCTAIPVKSLNITSEDFLSPDPRRRKNTLGQLARSLKESSIFDRDFEARLTRFVNDRNLFIHSWWTEQSRRSKSNSHLPTKDELGETYEFTRLLMREAVYIRNIFRGFYYALGKDRARKYGKEPKIFSELESWSRYVPEFRAILRAEREEP
jgi:hypothetical protein